MLLPEVMFSITFTTPSTNDSRSTIQSSRIDSFSSWLDAWNIYIAIIVAHNTSRASELLGYQRLIHSASKHFSTPAWLNYDVQFRTLAASNPQLRWDLHHSELWLENLASQANPCSLKSRGLAHIVEAHIIFLTDVLVVPFVQTNNIMKTLLSEMVDLDYSYAETSTTRPATTIPVITDTSAPSVVPLITPHTGVMGNHLSPADASDPLTTTHS